MHTILKYFYHKWIDSPRRWYPILSVYYLTYQCDFRCPYCSDGRKRPYYQLPNETLDPAEMTKLLKKIRKFSDYIVLTGGEPLGYQGLAPVMERIGGLRFREVIFTTNGYDLDRHLPVLAGPVDTLVVSLDTLDHKKADSWYGVGSGALGTILDNIDRAGQLHGKEYSIIISSVVTPDNISDLYEVFDFARERGFTFAACPQLVGVHAHGSLNGNSDYRAFFDFLIRKKKKGNAVYGTIKYLEYMRDLKKFRCHPFTMLVVSPTGEVFYPCLEIGRFAGNLLRDDIPLHDLRIMGERLYGPQPDCDVRCHSACALEFSIILNYPSMLFLEGYLAARARVRGLFRRR